MVSDLCNSTSSGYLLVGGLEQSLIMVTNSRINNGITGWWLGTMEFLDFPIILGIMIPIIELIFLRGVETTNQLTFPIHTKI